MTTNNEQQNQPKQATVIHLAHIKPGLTAAQRREIAEKLADVLLKDKPNAK